MKKLAVYNMFGKYNDCGVERFGGEERIVEPLGVDSENIIFAIKEALRRWNHLINNDKKKTAVEVRIENYILNEDDELEYDFENCDYDSVITIDSKGIYFNEEYLHLLDEEMRNKVFETDEDEE